VFFKDIIGRAGLSVSESRRLGVVFRKIEGLASRNTRQQAGRAIDPETNPP
jgi:hypothetical protein